MNVEYAAASDYAPWLDLAREVEHLFGPMADDPGFQNALKQAMSDKAAFCVRTGGNDQAPSFKGGIVISRETNEILWVAVSKSHRGKGVGKALLAFAMDKLDRAAPIRVQTFDGSIPEGRAARALYKMFGFFDHEDGGPNPAGIPTVIMQSDHTTLPAS